MVPFRWHFLLPKRIGPAMLTEGGKSWYHWQTHGFPTSPEIFVMVSCLATFIKVHSTKNGTLNIFAPDVIHCRKMWIHLDNSIRIQGTARHKSCYGAFPLLALVCAIENAAHFHNASWCLDLVFVGSASFHLSQLRPKVFLWAKNITRRLRSVGIGLVQMWCDLFWTSWEFPLRHSSL